MRNEPKQILKLDDYQLRALETGQIKQTGLAGLPYFLLDLFGEVGRLHQRLNEKAT